MLQIQNINDHRIMLSNDHITQDSYKGYSTELVSHKLQVLINSAAYIGPSVPIKYQILSGLRVHISALCTASCSLIWWFRHVLTFSCIRNVHAHWFFNINVLSHVFQCLSGVTYNCFTMAVHEQYLGFLYPLYYYLKY